MGTVSPGNNSGEGVESGSVMAMGMITQANDPTWTQLSSGPYPGYVPHPLHKLIGSILWWIV